MASITHHPQSETRASTANWSIALAARLIPASLAIAAGAIHLAMSPIHAPSSTTEAIGFAAVGWAQILLGIALLVRPGRGVLVTTIVLNAAVIVAYVVSRSVGLPVGANPGDAESVGTIDLMVTLFEGALIVCAALLLVRPDIAEIEGGFGAISFEALAAAASIPIIILAVTSVGLSDPELVQHSHGDAAGATTTGGHGHGGDNAAMLAVLAEDRCDLALNPAAYWRETSLASIDTLTGGQNPGPIPQVQGSQELDGVVALHSTVEGEIGDAQMVLKLSDVDNDVYDNWLRWLGASGKTDHSHDAANPAAPDDTTMGGHLGPQAWHAMTNQRECDTLQAELALARETALKYPTVADAKAAGWRQVTPYVPGIAAHFMNFSIVDDKFEIDRPEMILYDGTEDDARVVGLSYYIRHDGDAEPTQGFTGVNDHYHRHIGLCINASGVIGDSTTTEEECAAMGGRKAMGGNGWMNHAWVVPGCESPWGVFSGASPILDGDLGADHGKSGAACAGSGTRDRYNLTPGEVENVPTTSGGELELTAANQ
jgi:hypothetical protein